MVTLGGYIKRGREKAKLSQAALAGLVTACGAPCSQQLLSYWEQDENIPRADQLEAVAKALPRSCKLDKLNALAADLERMRRERAEERRSA